MSGVKVRSVEQIDRRHNLGKESFYVEIARAAELSDDLLTIKKSDIEEVLIYLGDGIGGREDGQHNQRVGISVEMAEWLQSTLVTTLTEIYRTRQCAVNHRPADDDEVAT